MWGLNYLGMIYLSKELVLSVLNQVMMLLVCQLQMHTKTKTQDTTNLESKSTLITGEIGNLFFPWFLTVIFKNPYIKIIEPYSQTLMRLFHMMLDY